MSKVERFKVSLNCCESIPIIPESNFYELEKSFNTQHKNHLTVIMMIKELFIYAEKKEVRKKIHKNNIMLRNLKLYLREPNSAELNIINSIKDENKEYKKQLAKLNNNTFGFDDILTKQLGI